MALILNLRGTNGSGKTTLARGMIPTSALTGNQDGGPVDLVHFSSPTKKDPQRKGSVTGYGSRGMATMLVGSYRTACGGLDTIASFGRQQTAIKAACRIINQVSNPTIASVVAEGVLASTVFGSWADFARETAEAGNPFAWVYLHVPLEVCLGRIRKRQQVAGGEREIKKELVADKIKAILSTRTKAISAGFNVFDLPYGGEAAALLDIHQRRDWVRYVAHA